MEGYPKVAGLDTSKSEVVHWFDGKVGSVRNERSLLVKFLRKLPEGTLVAVEATNRYHETVVEACQQLGITVYVVNPKEARNYKDSRSFRAKTDKLDAEYLSKFVSKHLDELRPYTPPPPAMRLAMVASSVREQGVKHRSSLSLVQGSLPEDAAGLFADEFQALHEALSALVKKAEQVACASVSVSPTYKLLLKVPGIGEATASLLTAVLESHTFKDSDAFVAYLGLDLLVCQSGMHRGRNRLSKRGDPKIRRVLFMAAWGCALTKKGKPYAIELRKRLSWTAAMVSIARKLARVAWAIHTTQTPYDPDKFLPGLKVQTVSPSTPSNPKTRVPKVERSSSADALDTDKPASTKGKQHKMPLNT